MRSKITIGLCSAILLYFSVLTIIPTIQDWIGDQPDDHQNQCTANLSALNCDLRIESASHDSDKTQLINQFKAEFESKKDACAMLIVAISTNAAREWTVAGYNDAGEFKTVLISDTSNEYTNNELAKELKRAEIADERELSTLAASILDIKRTLKHKHNPNRTPRPMETVHRIQLTNAGEFVDRCELTDVLTDLSWDNPRFKRSFDIPPKKGSTPGLPKLVVLFIHGWNHNGDDSDPHYIAFKCLVEQLREKHYGKKNVVGIYVAWNGASNLGPFYPLSFWSKKTVADRIAQSSSVTKIVSAIGAMIERQRDVCPDGCDLRLMSVDTADGLVNEGRNLVIVARVGTNLHIRIFDANGNRVVDKAENELIVGETLTTLKEQLNPLPDESDLSPEQKQKIIQDATSIAGHTLPDQFVAIGHSLGARVLFAAMAQPLIYQSEKAYPDKYGRPYAMISGSADLTIFLNPAFEASMYTALNDLKRTKETFQETQLPISVIISTENDEATKVMFPISQWIGSFRSEREITTIGNYQKYQTHKMFKSDESSCSALDGAGISEVYFDRNSKFCLRRVSCDLRLMSVDTADGLVNEGRNLVIVALVGTNLHIRIFDANGNRVVDKAENELISSGKTALDQFLGKRLTILKKQLNCHSDESNLPPAKKQTIIQDAAAIAGHTYPNDDICPLIQEHNPFMVVSTTPAVINGHNGIWTPQFASWLFDFVTSIVSQRDKGGKTVKTGYKVE